MLPKRVCGNRAGPGWPLAEVYKEFGYQEGRNYMNGLQNPLHEDLEYLVPVTGW